MDDNYLLNDSRGWYDPDVYCV